MQTNPVHFYPFAIEQEAIDITVFQLSDTKSALKFINYFFA